MKPSAHPTRIEKGTFGVLFAVASLMFLWTVSPIWVPIFFGVLLAVVASPLKRRLEGRHPRHPRLLAAGITAVTLAIGAGLVAVVFLLVGRELIAFFSGGDKPYLDQAMRWLYSRPVTHLLERIGETPDHLLSSLRSGAKSLVVHLTAILGGLVSVTSNALLTLFFTAITSYYLLLEGQTLKRMLFRMLPLPIEEMRSLLHEFREACVGILLSIGVVSLFQAMAAGLAFWICGVPKPLVWAALTGLASLIPAIGTALTCIPVAMLQIATGHLWSGVGVLIAWAVVVIAFADYVLRPRVTRGRIKLPDLLVLIGIFGGLEAFGAVGLAIGPLFVALFVALLRIYDRDYRPPRPHRLEPQAQ